MAKIMLCDDSSTILTLLGRKLTDAGHQIVGKAKDGNEGLALFSQTTPELTLLDVTMPNRDGRDCLKGILGLNPTAKVIMISALKDDSVVQECLSSGAKAFISKSTLYCKDDEFKKTVLSVIDSVLKAA
jgi:two-component system, chemotaxis family, chemotaxis protein CheY